MSAFAKEFANKELRGIIDGKDNVFNKTCRGWSSRHSTPSKAQAFETPTRPARAEGAVLGLPATGQAAAHFLAVTVTLYFNIILNAWFFFSFSWPSVIAELIRKSPEIIFPWWSLLRLWDHPVDGRQKEIQPFSSEPHFFILNGSIWIRFIFSWRSFVDSSLASFFHKD